MVSLFKGLGYLVSTISVLLLGIVAWKGAREEPLLLACLIAGMAASVAGMGLRWISHRLGEKEKKAIDGKAERAMGSADCAGPARSIRTPEAQQEKQDGGAERRNGGREPARGFAEPQARA